jgi:hypothetical protein
MKHIIFLMSLLLSSYLFSMDNCMGDRKLSIYNNTDRLVTVSYNKVLPGRIQSKYEKIAPGKAVEISLPVTKRLCIHPTGYVVQKVYAIEYQTPIIIGFKENRIVISQGKETLGVMEQTQKKAA